MKKIQLINHIQTAVALIDEDMTVIEANDAFQQRNKQKISNIVGSKCFHSAYNFNHSCSKKTDEPCPLTESFRTKKSLEPFTIFGLTIMRLSKRSPLHPL